MPSTKPEHSRSAKHAKREDESGILARSLNVLRAIAHADTPLGNRELADLTGLPKATISRITSRLIASGLVRQRPDSERFALGPAVLELSRAFLERLDMRHVFRDQMSNMVEELGVTAHLGIRDRLDIVLIETVHPRSAMLITRQGVGSRLSLATSAMGRSYLFALPAGERAALLKTFSEASGNASIDYGNGLQAASESLKARGFCIAQGKWSPEINAIATYLRAPDGELYCVSCSAPAQQLPVEELEGPTADRLKEAVAHICAETGAVTAFPVPTPDVLGNLDSS